MINDDALSSLERLHKLKTDGVITDEEFEKAKRDLLRSTSKPRASSPAATAPKAAWDGSLPAPDDHIGWAILPLKRYADFTGRSTAKEYWMFMLLGVVVLLTAGICLAIDEYGSLGKLATAIVVLAVIGTIIPGIAVEVRRFHDQDRSGWFALLNLVPYVGWLIVLIMMTIGGTPGENRFGPDPKRPV